jgi:hypothetical protein
MPEVFPLMPTVPPKSPLRAFFDFFILFSGISTASNLERTQGRPLRTRGLFLFRGKKSTSTGSATGR